MRRQYPPPQHEVKDAFVRWLNAKRGASYQLTSEPDKTQRNRPEIDYVLADSTRSPELALEVSSVWRSGDAGKGDAYFTKWFEEVRKRLHGRVNGSFNLGLPLEVPRVWDAAGFADDLVALIQREAVQLADSLRTCGIIAVEIRGIRFWVRQTASDGGLLDYSRLGPVEPNAGFVRDMKRVLDAKAPKLKPYKAQGYETWIVAYSTAWPLYPPDDVQRVVSSLLSAEHAHVDHVGICYGNPPNDALFVEVP